MSNRRGQRISELDDGGALQVGDLVPIARDGVNYRIDLGAVDGAVSLARLGVVADGTDQTAAINAIMAEYGARSYRVSRNGGATVLASGRLLMPAGAWLVLDDDVTLNVGQIVWLGTESAEAAFTAEITRGATAIPFTTASISGLAVDDYLMLVGCLSAMSADAGPAQLGYKPSQNKVFFGEYVRVAAVAPGAATIYRGTHWDYTNTPGPDSGTRTTSTARKINWTGGGIRGGTIVCNTGYTPVAFDGAADAILGSNRLGLILALYAKDFRVVGCRIEMGAIHRYGVQLVRCLDPRAVDNVLVREPHLTSDAGDYRNNGYVCQETHGFIGTLNTVDGGFQAFDSDYLGTYGIVHMNNRWIGNTIRNAGEGGTTHPGGTGHAIDGNIMQNVSSMARIRTPSTSCCDNQATAGNAGNGVFVHDGFFDGSRIARNFIDGFDYAIYVDWASTGVSNGGTLMVEDNQIAHSRGIFVEPSAIEDADRRAVLIRRNTVTAPLRAHIQIGAYANGSVVEHNICAGQPTSYSVSYPAAIIIDGNIAELTIGCNRFDDIGPLYALGGPGDTILTDATTWPGGDAEANWVIAAQDVHGAANGERTNLPGTMTALQSSDAYGPAARAGRLTLRALGAQSEAPLAVRDSGDSADLWSVDSSGRLAGSVPDAAAAALLAGSFDDNIRALFNVLFATRTPLLTYLYSANDGLVFSRSTYRQSGVTSAVLADITNFALMRATPANAYDANGTKHSFVSGAARVTTRGLGVFEQTVNQLFNAGMAGYTLNGTDSGRPTGWGITLLSGLHYSITAAGIELGRTYVDLRVYGTPSATGASQVQFGSNADVAGANGDVRTFQVGIKLSAGSLTNITSPVLVLVERDSGGTPLTSHTSSSIAIDGTIRDNVYTATMSNASCAEVSSQFKFSGTNGNPIDVTFRIYEPMERLAALSVPWVTTPVGATGTANADVATLTSEAYGAGHAFTFFCEADMNAYNGAIQILAQWDDGTDSNRVVLYRDASGNAVFDVRVGGVSQYSRSVASKTGARTLRMAISNGGGTLTTCCDQETPVGVATPASMPAVTRWRVGSSGSGQYLNGYVRSVLGFQSALTGSTLQALQA